MTLNEFVAENGDKTIEIQDDGTIRILEEKGPWKPENEEFYYTITATGDMTTLYWDGDIIDNFKLEIGNVFRTEAEAERTVHRLKARKKFLDAGGHEGMNGYVFGYRYHAYPQRCDKTLIVVREGGVTAFDIWFETEEDCNRAINSLSDDEKAALCWTGESE